MPTTTHTTTAELTRAALVRLSPEDHERMSAAAAAEGHRLASWLRHQARLALEADREREAA